MTSQHRLLWWQWLDFLSREDAKWLHASQMLEGGNSDLISVADFKSLAS